MFTTLLYWLILVLIVAVPLFFLAFVTGALVDFATASKKALARAAAMANPH